MTAPENKLMKPRWTLSHVAFKMCLRHYIKIYRDALAAAPPLRIQWADDCRKLGVFSGAFLPKDTILGAYNGELVQVHPPTHPLHIPYTTQAHPLHILYTPPTHPLHTPYTPPEHPQTAPEHHLNHLTPLPNHRLGPQL